MPKLASALTEYGETVLDLFSVGLSRRLCFRDVANLKLLGGFCYTRFPCQHLIFRARVVGNRARYTFSVQHKTDNQQKERGLELRGRTAVISDIHIFFSFVTTQLM